MENHRNIRLPFSGFYESMWNSDSNDEQFCEYEANERQREENIPEAEWLTEAEYSDILLDSWKNKEYELAVCLEYVNQFNAWAKRECDIDLDLKYETMTSPREYNFETDRIFCWIPNRVVKALFDKSAEDGHAALSEVIEKRCTSRSGFISFYSNDLSKGWLEKPVLEWDHNELGILLEAVTGFDQNCEWEIYEYWPDGLYCEWEQGVDWPKLESMIEAKRTEKRTT